MTKALIKSGLLFSLFFVLIACGAEAEPGKPTARITSLAEGSQVQAGQDVSIEFEAGDVQGIVQVEITINGQPVHLETASPPVNVLSGAYIWKPQTNGSHLIQVMSFNVDGATSEVAQVAVTVVGGGAEAAPTEVATEETTASVEPTGTATRPLVPPTPSGGSTPVEEEPTATATTAATAEPDEEVKVTPLVTAKVSLNVRNGPSTNYEVVGRLAADDVAEITGQDVFGGWWQIVFPAGEGGRGWVAAGPDFSSATNAENVPVVDPPPLVGGDTGDDKPIIHYFRTERESIASGESVVLSWDLENATEAFLRVANSEEGVIAPGSKTVSPTADTTYTLVARNGAGETTAEVTISVVGATATPVAILGNGTVTVFDGQAIDFEQGLATNDGVAGVDFYWNGQTRSFERRNGAIGVLMSKAFADLTLSDCMTAPYGDPITGVNESQPIIGCYRTSDSRFGKFVITDWDVSARLTIDWLTWQ